MSILPDPEKLAQRTIEILGGLEKANEIMDREFGDMRRRWDQDVEAIGRLLRAHLYLEHYLTEYLQRANPRLGSLDKTRIIFSNKVELLDPQDANLKGVVPGIKHLNSIRNRLAHNLSTRVTADDAAKFLSCAPFKAFREAGARAGKPSEEPLVVLEAFAQFAVHQLTGEFSQFSAASAQAIRELSGNVAT